MTASKNGVFKKTLVTIRSGLVQVNSHLQRAFYLNKYNKLGTKRFSACNIIKNIKKKFSHWKNTNKDYFIWMVHCSITKKAFIYRKHVSNFLKLICILYHGFNNKITKNKRFIIIDFTGKYWYLNGLKNKTRWEIPDRLLCYWKFRCIL